MVRMDCLLISVLLIRLQRMLLLRLLVLELVLVLSTALIFLLRNLRRPPRALIGPHFCSLLLPLTVLLVSLCWLGLGLRPLRYRELLLLLLTGNNRF